MGNSLCSESSPADDSLCLSVCLSVGLCVCVCVCVCVCLSVSLSVCLSVCLSVSLSVCLSVSLVSFSLFLTHHVLEGGIVADAVDVVRVDLERPKVPAAWGARQLVKKSLNPQP